MPHDRDQRVYGFSKSGHARVSSAVRYLEKIRGGMGLQEMPNGKSASPVTVKVTHLPEEYPDSDPLYHVGVFSVYHSAEEEWEDLEEKCYIFQESFENLVVGTRYPGQVLDSHDHGAVIVLVSVGGGIDWFPAKITGSSGSPLAYSWTEQEMTSAGVWADKSGGLSGTTNAYRMPSDESAPVVESGQYVLIRESPTSDGEYEMSPWGSLTSQTVTVGPFLTDVSVSKVETACVDGVFTVAITLTKTTKSQDITIKGRDVTASAGALY